MKKLFLIISLILTFSLGAKEKTVKVDGVILTLANQYLMKELSKISLKNPELHDLFKQTVKFIDLTNQKKVLNYLKIYTHLDSVRETLQQFKITKGEDYAKDLLKLIDISFYLVDYLDEKNGLYYIIHDFRTVDLVYPLFELIKDNPKLKKLASKGQHPLIELYLTQIKNKKVIKGDTLDKSFSLLPYLKSCRRKNLYTLFLGEKSTHKPIAFYDYKKKSYRLIDKTSVDISEDQYFSLNKNFLTAREVFSSECYSSLVPTENYKRIIDRMMNELPEVPIIDFNPRVENPLKLEIPPLERINLPSFIYNDQHMRNFSKHTFTSLKSASPITLSVGSEFLLHKKLSQIPFENLFNIELKKLNTYSYYYGIAELNRFNLKKNFFKNKFFSSFDYQDFEISVVKALSKRYAISIDSYRLMNKGLKYLSLLYKKDYSLNKDRNKLLKSYCTSSDLELCDDKILAPNIYTLDSDKEISVDSLVFHPLAFVKTYGRDIDIKANVLINPFIDTSGEINYQKHLNEILDPGKSYSQGYSKKTKERDCDVNAFGIKVNCKTYHYFNFFAEKSGLPQTPPKKRPSFNGGNIYIDIKKKMSLFPIFIARGGDGDKGYKGLPSPDCNKEKYTKNYLLDTKGEFLNMKENKALSNAIKQVQGYLTYYPVAKGDAGLGGDGGNGGVIKVKLPKKYSLNYVFSVSGGSAGETGDLHECGPNISKKFTTTMPSSNKGKSGVFNEIYYY